MLKLKEINELLALHRFICETKFVASMDNPVGHGSGYIAKIARDNLKAMIEYYEDNGLADDAQEWREWMILTKESVAYDRIIERIKAMENFSEFDRDRQSLIVRDLGAPYTIDDETVKQILSSRE